eukprot:g2339.t1
MELSYRILTSENLSLWRKDLPGSILKYWDKESKGIGNQGGVSTGGQGNDASRLRVLQCRLLMDMVRLHITGMQKSKSNSDIAYPLSLANLSTIIEDLLKRELNNQDTDESNKDVEKDTAKATTLAKKNKKEKPPNSFQRILLDTLSNVHFLLWADYDKKLATLRVKEQESKKEGSGKGSGTGGGSENTKKKAALPQSSDEISTQIRQIEQSRRQSLTRMNSMIKDFIEKNIFSVYHIWAHLPLQLLQILPLCTSNWNKARAQHKFRSMKSPEQLTKKVLVQYNTKKNWVTKTHHLFHESPEGFAHILSILLSNPHIIVEEKDDDSAEQLQFLGLEENKSYTKQELLLEAIGRYELDTTRVTDIILDCAESALSHLSRNKNGDNITKKDVANGNNNTLSTWAIMLNNFMELLLSPSLCSPKVILECVIRKLQRCAEIDDVQAEEIPYIAQIARVKTQALPESSIGRREIQEWVERRKVRARPPAPMKAYSLGPSSATTGGGGTEKKGPVDYLPTVYRKALVKLGYSDGNVKERQALHQGNTPLALLDLIALLIAHNVFTIDAIWDSEGKQLAPADSCLKRNELVFQNHEINASEEYGRVSLRGKSKLNTELELIDAWEKEEMQMIHLRSNQKIGLLRSFLRLRLWEDANVIIERFKSLKSKPKKNLFFVETFAQFATKLIVNMYAKYAAGEQDQYGTTVQSILGGLPQIFHYTIPGKEEKQLPSFEKLITILPTLGPLLTQIGGRLHAPRTHKFYYMLCRLIVRTQDLLDQHAIVGTKVEVKSEGTETKSTKGRKRKGGKKQKKNHTTKSGSKALTDVMINTEIAKQRKLFYQWLEHILGFCLLPSLALVKENASLSHEVWKILKRMPWYLRYKLYTRIKCKAYNTDSSLILKRAMVTVQFKKMLKRVGNEKGAVATTSRRLAALSSYNPVIICSIILEQVEAYESMVGSLATCLQYCDALTFDILIFLIIDRLGTKRQSGTMKPDGINYQDWIIGLSRFTGIVFRTYSSRIPNFSGIWQFLASKVKSSTAHLLVVEAIIQEMAGLEVLQEPSKDQLTSLTGGSRLQALFAHTRRIFNPSASNLLRQHLLFEGGKPTPSALVSNDSVSSSHSTIKDNSRLDIVQEWSPGTPEARKQECLAISLLRSMVSLQAGTLYWSESIKTLKQMGNRVDQISFTIRLIVDFIQRETQPNQCEAIGLMSPHLHDVFQLFSLLQGGKKEDTTMKDEEGKGSNVEMTNLYSIPVNIIFTLIRPVIFSICREKDQEEKGEEGEKNTKGMISKDKIRKAWNILENDCAVRQELVSSYSIFQTSLPHSLYLGFWTLQLRHFSDPVQLYTKAIKERLSHSDSSAKANHHKSSTKDPKNPVDPSVSREKQALETELLAQQNDHRL